MASAVVAAVAASVVLGAAPHVMPRAQKPAAQKPAAQTPAAPAAVLREITGEESFRAVFDSAATAPRLVLLLSPT